MSERENLESDILEKDNETISLAPFFTVLIRYRYVLLIGLLIAAVTIGSFTALVYLNQKQHVTYKMGFSLNFYGLKNDSYPNGQRFSPSEILMQPVLKSVYEKNDLTNRIPFSAFSGAITVLQDSPQLRFLEMEYTAKLAQSRLSQAERASIEDEFVKKRDSLKNNNFIISFSPLGGAAADVSKDLAFKILVDILNTWSEHTAKVQGNFKYTIPVVTVYSMRSNLENLSNPLLEIESIKRHLSRLQRTVGILQDFPGAESYVIKDEKIGLSDLASMIADVRFYLEYLEFIIIDQVSQEESISAQTFIETQEQKLKLRLGQIENQIQSLEQAISKITRLDIKEEARDTSDPTLSVIGGRSIESLVELVSSAEDSKLRQKLTLQLVDIGFDRSQILRDYNQYMDQLKRLKDASHSSNSPGIKKADVLNEIIVRTEDITNLIQEFFESYSYNSLHPQTHLYRITSPPQVSIQKQFSLKKLLLSAGILFILASIFLFSVCLIHQQIFSRYRV